MPLPGSCFQRALTIACCAWRARLPISRHGTISASTSPRQYSIAGSMLASRFDGYLRIGDVQGCFDELQALLARLDFGKRDRHSGSWAISSTVGRSRSRSSGFCAKLGTGGHCARQSRPHLVTHTEGFRASAQGRHDPRCPRGTGPKGARRLLRKRPMMHASGEFAMVHAGCCRNGRSSARSSSGASQGALRRRKLSHFLATCTAASRTVERQARGMGSPARHRQRDDAMRFATPKGKMGLPCQRTEAPQGFRAWFDCGRGRKACSLRHWSALG